MLILLEDSGSSLIYSVGVDSGGIITCTLASGIPMSVFLNDPNNSTSWQLGVVAAGPNEIVIATEVSLGSYPKALPLDPIANSYQLQVSSGGGLQAWPLLLGPFGPDEDFMLYRFRAA